jgi:hypothetical protein
MKALVIAMEILLGSNGTTEPLRRMTLYWSNGRLGEVATDSELCCANEGKTELETPSVASSMKLPFIISRLSRPETADHTLEVKNHYI